MASFVAWFNAPEGTDFVVKAALAHLRFATIHPFEDGNGRIARAVAEMLLARSDQNDRRFYSMSAQISKERRDYYMTLEATQKGGLDVTSWLCWFLECLERAIDRAQDVLKGVLRKARFRDATRSLRLNARQTMMLDRLLDGFTGKLTTSKWAKIANCSHDTALRDIRELLDHGILVRSAAAGRSTNYEIAGTGR